jgi:LPS-assembly protein
MYYLYTPYVSQQRQPNFDTTLPALDHDKLFSKNRFTGVDRISNANRITLGLTSRVLDPYDGKERFKARVTDALYLQDYKVCGDDCDIRDESDYVMSPVVGEMSYHINSTLEASSNAVYDPAQSKISNAGAELAYHSEHNRIVDLGYNFVQGEDEFAGARDGDSRNDLNRVQAGLAWPIYHHWHAFGHMAYNISHGFKQNAFYGVEYNGCCWALRLMRNTNLIAVNDRNSPEYDRDLFIQFSLKGLNKISTNDPHQLLTSGLRGYNDVFKE